MSDKKVSDQQTYLIPRQHAHVSFVIVRTIRISLAIIFPMAIGLWGAFSPLSEKFKMSTSMVIASIAAICGAIVLIVALWSYLSWKRFSWEVTPTELNIYSGVIFRNNEHISLTRIHSIDNKQTLVERILGVVGLKVITASGMRGREARIEGITLTEAESLTRVVFDRKEELESQANVSASGSDATPSTMAATTSATGGVVATAKEAIEGRSSWLENKPLTPDADMAQSLAEVSSSVRGIFGGASSSEQSQFEYHLSTKDLLLTGLSSNNVLYFLLFIPLTLLGILSELGFSKQLFDFMAGLGFTLLIVAALASLFIGWFFSVIHALTTYAGFKVRRCGPRIDVEQGLISKHATGISIERVQSVRVKRGLIRRIIGYAEISVDTVQGISNENEINKASIVHPFIKFSEVDDFIGQLLPEFAHRPHATTPLPRRALTRLIFRSTFWIALFALVPVLFFGNVVLSDLWAFAPWVANLAVITVLLICVLCGMGLFRARKWGKNDSMIAIQKGLLSRDVTYIAKRKMQWMRLSETWFQKRQKLVTFRVLTAAGSPGSGTQSTIIDLARPQGEEVLEWAWLPLKEEVTREQSSTT